MPFSLPKTYYDFRTEEQPLIAECVRQDLRLIQKEGLSGPFFDPDILKGFDRYFDYAFTNIAQKAKDSFRQLAGFDELYFRRLWEDFTSKDTVGRIEFFLTADYLVLLNFELFGKKSLFFTDNLVEHLVHTELDAPSSSIKLPFESCLFVITAKSVIEAIWQLRGTDPESFEPLNIFLTEAVTSADEGGIRKVVFVCYQKIPNGEPFFVKRSLLIREDWSIRHMLRTDWLSISPESKDEKSFALDDDDFYENRGVLLFYRVLLNCILYLESNDAEIIKKLSPHRRAASINRKQKREILFDPPNSDREISKLDYHLIGADIPPLIIQRIVVDDDGTENVDDALENDRRSETKRLSIRFIVRGHWRKQPFGKGSEERKLIWIKPHYKGPEMSELINRPILVR